MAIGVEPDNGLEEELRRRISAEIYSVGDCEEDGNKKIGRAIYSATRVAYKI